MDEGAAAKFACVKAMGTLNADARELYKLFLDNERVHVSAGKKKGYLYMYLVFWVHGGRMLMTVMVEFPGYFLGQAVAGCLTGWHDVTGGFAPRA